jgi:hypothetical protein
MKLVNQPNLTPLPSNWELLQIYYYKDGHLYYTGSGKGRKLFRPIGCVCRAGLKTSVPNGTTGVHRIIFKMFYGTEPPVIDHINGNNLDNRIENLREATTITNGYNRKINMNNKLGIKNVCYKPSERTYRVTITINKKQKEIFRTKDLELAELVAQEARDKYHGQYARHR